MAQGVARHNFRRGGGAIDLAAAWKGGAIAAGGTVSDARLILVRRLYEDIQGLPIDYLLVPAAENTQSALLDLVGLKTATLVAAPTFTTDRGYQGNGTTSYVNASWNPTANAIKWSQNSAHLSIYNQSFSTGLACGCRATNMSEMWTPFTDAKIYPRLNVSGDVSGGSGFAGGFYIADRVDGATITVALNGVDQFTISPASAASANVNMFIGAVNNNGTAINFSDSRFGAFSAGGSLGSTGRVRLYNAIQNYMTAIGA